MNRSRRLHMLHLGQHATDAPFIMFSTRALNRNRLGDTSSCPIMGCRVSRNGQSSSASFMADSVSTFQTTATMNRSTRLRIYSLHHRQHASVATCLAILTVHASGITYVIHILGTFMFGQGTPMCEIDSKNFGLGKMVTNFVTIFPNHL